LRPRLLERSHSEPRALTTVISSNQKSSTALPVVSHLLSENNLVNESITLGNATNEKTTHSEQTSEASDVLHFSMREHLARIHDGLFIGDIDSAVDSSMLGAARITHMIDLSNRYEIDPCITLSWLTSVSERICAD
jgi:hypothetical protein